MLRPDRRKDDEPGKSSLVWLNLRLRRMSEYAFPENQYGDRFPLGDLE